MNSYERWSLGVSVCGIVVNAVIACHIVKRIQSTFINSRTLKDYFIVEIKDLRISINDFINDLLSNNLDSSKIIPKLKAISIRITEILTICNEKYNIDINILNSYQTDINKIITSSDEYEEIFKKDKKLCLSETNKKKISIIHQNNRKHFDRIIVDINDYHKSTICIKNISNLQLFFYGFIFIVSLILIYVQIVNFCVY